jgi:hypothetical protein
LALELARSGLASSAVALAPAGFWRWDAEFGAVGGPRLLADVRDCLQLLRDETSLRRDSAMSERTIIEEISASVIQRHPDWTGQEWIEKGVSCLCSEHPA